MIIHLISRSNILIITIFLWLISPFHLFAKTHDVAITIHLRGVYESKICLLSLSSSGTFKPLAEVQGIKNGETTQLSVPKEKLPGEFVLRFDYKEKESSTPYPSKKYIFINDQDLELWVSPMYCNNGDSTWFQKDERENTVFMQFSKENVRVKRNMTKMVNSVTTDSKRFVFIIYLNT